MPFLRKYALYLLKIAFCAAFLISSCATPKSIPSSIDESSSMSSQELVNLETFTRLLGYIQYFHPSDSARNTNWESFAVEGVSFIENASNCADLVDRLQVVFLPIAPTLRIFTIDNPLLSFYQEIPMTETGPLEIVSWQHHGFGRGINQNIYYDELIFTPVNSDTSNVVNNPLDPYRVNLGCGITALVPLSLYVDKQGTLPYQITNSEYIAPTFTFTPTNEREKRIAVVALSWNILQHFYPYFSETNNNWLITLRTALLGVDAVKDEEEFMQVLQKMMADLKDGHGRVYTEFPPSTNIYRPPFGWEWVENKLVITFVDEEFDAYLRPGDSVIKINGKNTKAVLEAQKELISGATQQWITFRSVQDLLMGPSNSTISLTTQTPFGIRNTSSFTRTVYMGLNPFLFTELRPEVVTEVQDKIWYVDLTRITDTQFISTLSDLEEAKGIVFDMRGYPFLAPSDFIGHLIDQEALWPLIRIPIITNPDSKFSFYDEIIQKIEPRTPRLTSNIVFLADGRVISYAESIMQTIKFNQIGKIIGTPTAGTNGNIAVFTLFEKYTFQFTGMEVLNSDRSPHHGIGVEPNITALRTLKGIRGGQDELLTQAIYELTH